jgi:murein DD-endopeptidase MepM/ murein hydrolase activator NlpD
LTKRKKYIIVLIKNLKPTGFMKVKIRVRKLQKKELAHLPLILFILLTLIVFFIISFLSKKNESVVPAEEKKEIDLETKQDTTPELTELRETIQRGETLSDILSRHDFSPSEIHKIRTEVLPVYDLRKIKASQEIRLYTTAEGVFSGLEYDIDRENYLCIRKEEGIYQAGLKIFPFETEIHMIWGTIEDNLPNAITREGEKEILGYELAEIFAWDIDFYTDLRKGDSFQVLFEKKFLRNEFVDYGPILAAEFQNQGKKFQAFRFTYPDTKESDYFSPDGESLRREFLKSPIKFARITSRFSHSRLHPIRKVFRPHYGVDYAAKPGTPVQATADGTVTLAGWNGASGRMIKIRHSNFYETMYLHLRKCFVKKEDKVKGSQIIGEVGASGEATGPHLDYRIRYHGRYINPLTHRFKPVKPLRPDFLEDFKAAAQNYRLCMEAPLIIFSSF